MRKRLTILATTLLAIPGISGDVKADHHKADDSREIISEDVSMEKISESRCGNCGSYLDAEDKYCKICGTKAGEGEYKASEDIMQCIYGPMPVERIHICEKCGYSWNTNLMIDKETFCPKCGGHAPGMEESETEKTEPSSDKQHPFRFFINWIKKLLAGLSGK